MGVPQNPKAGVFDVTELEIDRLLWDCGPKKFGIYIFYILGTYGNDNGDWDYN